MRGWKIFMMCLMVLALMAMPLLACSSDDEDEYDLTMAKTGNGIVTPSVGDTTFTDGMVVDIMAVADAGWMFDSWTGDVADSDSASTTVTMDEAQTVTATFVEAYTLTILSYGDGDGTISPAAGIYTYPKGDDTVVDITATPNTGTTFNGWTGDVADADSEDTTVTMDADQAVTAVFTLEVYPTGTITSHSNGDTVSGTVTIEATLTDNQEVIAYAGYGIDLDLTADPATLVTYPVFLQHSGPSISYSYDWDSTAVANGEHVFFVLLRDNLGQGGLASVTLTVDN